MKKTIVMGICLLLIGGLIMPAQAHNFTIQISPPVGKNVSVYDDNGKFIGKTNETGFFIFCLDDLELGEERYLTLKKGGYEDMTVKIYNAGCNNGIFGGMQKIKPKPTPEPPEVTPIPTISQEQRISELENATTEYETRISWLENKVNGILNWVRSKFGDLI